jgi:hypothetical protein
MRLIAAIFAALVLAPSAFAGGPAMRVGASEDAVKQKTLAQAKARLDLLRLAGLDSVRVTLTWAPGATKPAADDMTSIENLVDAAGVAGIKVYVSVSQYGSSTTPLTDEARSQFAAYATAVATRFPTLAGMVVGNEPNLNRFWLPQFNPDGSDAAAPAFLQLLAQTYDAIKAVRPSLKVYGVGLSPRGNDNPTGTRLTHSPTTFLRDLGAAYRASGRTTPIMDGLALHPYQDNSSQPPTFQHPNSTSISISDYDKLMALLAEAFDGTAQPGSTLHLLYDEYGVESQIPAAKAGMYTGSEPTTTKPVDEATQAAYYQQAIAIAFCQPNVDGIFLFHAIDENDLPGWQSGVYYDDLTPKSSRAGVAEAASLSRRGVIAACPWLHLTPRVRGLKWPQRLELQQHQASVAFTCNVDCAYDVSMTRRGKLVTRKIGTAIGGTERTIPLRKRLASGPYAIRIAFTAPVNKGATVVRTTTVKVP